MLPASDPWAALRGVTRARIGLARTGDAVATSVLLELQAAHAAARDAVHVDLDADRVRAALSGQPVLTVDSAAPDRATYLQRPDLGRRLATEARDLVADQAGEFDLVLVVADGLSALAVHEHAAAVVHALVPKLPGWRLAPVVVARQARVALGDEVGELVGAAAVVVLVGERPGLSAPDSLGAYLTWGPRVGRHDGERNCVSNIRPPHGQSPEQAAATLARLLHEARRRGLSGVPLKDDAEPELPDPGSREQLA